MMHDTNQITKWIVSYYGWVDKFPNPLNSDIKIIQFQYLNQFLPSTHSIKSPIVNQILQFLNDISTTIEH